MYIMPSTAFIRIVEDNGRMAMEMSIKENKTHEE